MNCITAHTSIPKVNLLFLKVKPAHLFNKYLSSTQSRPGTTWSSGDTTWGNRHSLSSKRSQSSWGDRYWSHISVIPILSNVLKKRHLNYHLKDGWVGQMKGQERKPYLVSKTNKQQQQHLQSFLRKIWLVKMSKTEDMARIPRWGERLEMKQEEPPAVIVQGPIGQFRIFIFVLHALRDDWSILSRRLIWIHKSRSAHWGWQNS